MGSGLSSLIFHSPILNQKEIETVKADPKVKICNLEGINYYTIKSDNSNKCVVFCHGTNSTIYSNYNFAKKLANTLNVDVIVWDYPGYGLSQGNPTPESCVKSLHKILKNLNHKDVLMMGYSLGNGIITEYAYKAKFSGPLILIAPFKEISKDVFPTSTWVTKLNNPIKIYHSLSDELFDKSHADEIYNNMKNKIWEPTFFKGVSHTDILNWINLKELSDFI